MMQKTVRTLNAIALISLLLCGSVLHPHVHRCDCGKESLSIPQHIACRFSEPVLSSRAVRQVSADLFCPVCAGLLTAVFQESTPGIPPSIAAGNRICFISEAISLPKRLFPSPRAPPAA